MQWLEKFNEAVEYIESHIRGRIDYAEAARIACCSPARFQRMFAFAADTTPAEYVRRRRMSLSSLELMGSDIKVVDLAMKYGYESPEAFTRAFQAFHGVSPTKARRLGVRTDYPPISVDIRIGGGNVAVGEKPLVRIEEHGGERAVCFREHCRGPEEPAWRRLRDWAMANLPDYPARSYIGCAPQGHHPRGEAHQSDEEAVVHEYLAQMFLLRDEGRFESFLGAPVCDAPGGLFLVGDVVLNEYNSDGNIDIGTSMQNAYGVMAQCLQQMGGYAFEMGTRPYLEEHIFARDWPAGDRGLAGFKLWLPIGKSGG